jgi:hypothetical protein
MLLKLARAKKTIEPRMKMIAKIKDHLAKDNIYLSLCQEHGKSPSIINAIPIVFTDKIDVTAKTVNSKIFLNTSLLDKTFKVVVRYVLHEMVHAFQHMEKEGKNNPPKKKVYLDRPEEIEAFQYQIEYDEKHRGKEKADDYVDELLSYHKIPDNKRPEKKKELKENL